MEYLVFILMILAFILIIMCKGYLDEKKRKKKFNLWLREHYGELPKREAYKPEEFEKISHYFRSHENEGFHIDDITWNDLNMDAVFARMNYTFSAAGEEYLYYMLRSPMQCIEKEEHLEEQINFFMEEKEERIKYQIFFAEIGKIPKYSIYDYLDYLDLLGERDNKPHVAGNLFILLAALFMIWSAPVGILLLFVAIARNIVTYFKIKNEIDPYITSFGYILRLLRNVEGIEKNSVPVFEKQIQELEKHRKKLGKFKSGAYIVMSSNRMIASSNPLEIILDYLRMSFHLDLIKFNTMLAEVRKNIEHIDKMITITGHMEAVIAIGAYRASGITYCIPALSSSDELDAENLYHPLIENPVKNSISTKRGVLLTGSNASGKSTFLKTMAVNAILAQTIHTVLADSYTGRPFRILSSMALRDDLAGGDSYYIVEIKSLKRILSCADEAGCPVLCFVDEVLRGTNTVERVAASTQILKSLAGENVICFAATHDIELTHLLEADYNNYHFEEEVKEGDIVFNYKLLSGRATTRNAIKLLSVMGYKEDIIKRAEALAEGFLKSGKWEL